MAGVIGENYLSRRFELGPRNARELVYNVTGTEDEEEVFDLLSGTAPATYLGLTLESYAVEPDGGGSWKGYVRYAAIDGASEYSFKTGGAVAKITQAIETIGSYAPAYATAPDFQGAIGVSEDRVEGTDIPIPKYEWTETHRFTDAQVDAAYLATLLNLTTRVNDDAFRGYAAGEVLLQDVQGAKRGDELWTITFYFAQSPNITGLTIGDITGISKGGWDYLWIRYGDFSDQTAYALVKRPIAAYVERVFWSGDFAGLGIGES